MLHATIAYIDPQSGTLLLQMIIAGVVGVAAFFRNAIRFFLFSPKAKPIGGVLLVSGIICAFYGISRINSIASQLANRLGQSDITAIVAIALGVGAALLGVVMLITGRDKRDQSQMNQSPGDNTKHQP